MDDIPYEVTGTEKVKNLEADLVRELAELKNELEENEMVHGLSRTVSSVLLPKDAAHFRRERASIIQRTLEVSEAKKLNIQADAMKEELDISSRSDYTPDSMALILHQYFTDRIQQLVQCKHLHMLRWKRFHEHTSTIEALYPYYQDRLGHIMSEYNDCLDRAERLSVARESFLAGNNTALLAVKVDDLLIYLRWLVCHLHAIKKFNQYMRVLEWLPVVHKTDVTPVEIKQHEEEEESTTSRIPSRYHDDQHSTAPRSGNISRPTSAAMDSSHSQYGGGMQADDIKPPPIDPTKNTTNPLPASQTAFVMAASGGGLASDESSLKIPLHVNDFPSLKLHLQSLLKSYGIEMDVNEIQSSSEEMEMYAHVNRKFRQAFTRQEHLKTFKTYDKAEIGQETWGADHSMHALRQESNWIPYITLKPEKNPEQEKRMNELKMRKKIDELLKVQAKFLSVSDPDKVQDALREHAAAIRDPPVVQASDVSNRKRESLAAIWKRIYINPELYAQKDDPLDVALQEFEERESGTKSRATSARKRRESYEYFDAVQLLGLDEGEQDSNDPASIQGAYLSFLQLRHLKLRDLQRTSLGVLNYFRSVERTLTINDGGLSLDTGHLKRASQQDHRRDMVDGGGVGGGGGLGSHHYLHYTPKDFKVSEAEFMEYSEVENHDDFYQLEEGRVHVQDQRGYYIMYDSAEEDFKLLEEDLLVIASHYIEKDKELRYASRINTPSSANRRQFPNSAGDFDIGAYSHQEIDRFGVLLDTWTHETAFLECKKELIDCYMEAYHHVFDRDEKRCLAQVITDLIHLRPRFDFSAPYFLRTYRLECITLRLKAQLLKSMLDKQIEEQREYITKVCRDGDTDYGLPLKVIPKQPVSINLSRSALKSVYMLEFHPSLAFASRISHGLKHAYWELYHIHKPETVTQTILLEKKMLECAVKDWEKMDVLGAGYSLQTQKDLFSGVFVEDPLFLTEIAQTQVVQEEQIVSRKSQKEKQEAIVGTVCKLLEIYRKQAVSMGYDECHLFLRFVQFEFANYKESAGTPPPVFITSIQEDDSSVDRYTPNYLYLAIHELDESHVGRFSFRSRDGVMQLLKGTSIASLQVILMTQIVHKNALMCAVQQANACQAVQDVVTLNSARPLSPVDTKSEKSSATAMTGLSSGTGATSLGVKMSGSSHKNKKSPEAFLSVQLEKGPSRDLMLNEFINKKQQMGTILRNTERMEELKRKLLAEYCQRFQIRVAQYSLRGQILHYYNSILGLLKHFPNIRDTYFMMGEPHEKKTNLDSVSGLQEDARTLQKRPRRVLSEDGKHFLNLWFIPHYTEVLVMYKKLDDDDCRRALTYHLHSVVMIHDILQYLCAHAKLGSSQARLGSKRVEFVSADWGGTEGVGSDLREIQRQIDHLDNRTSPQAVCQFLTLRRDVMFLEFDAAVRHTMRDTFLATGNQQAYNAITECMHFALFELSNAQKPAFGSVNLNVPEPLEARDAKAWFLFPWRTFLNRLGPYPVHLPQCQQIEHNMQLCLAGLKDVDRHVANGEILGVSLLMEDVLLSGEQDQAVFMDASDDEEADAPSSSQPQSSRSNKQPTTDTTGSLIQTLSGADKKSAKKLSRTLQPIESYMLMKSFLLLWKRLEVLKKHWGCSKLLQERINSPSKYKSFCREYKKDILYPILGSVARRLGQTDLYEGLVSDDEPVVTPRGASEMEIKMRQLVKLLENLECTMINEVRKKIAREVNLVLAERSREESALPTDLWKRPAMKESFTINKPHIAEDFIDSLMKDGQEDDGGRITFSTAHLNKCLSQLASSVMAREKHNYENYSMYYENHLRLHHQLLYQREQEIKQLKDQIRLLKAHMSVEVQCQLADTSQDLLLEVTALRAKISEMREMSLTQERDVRGRVQEEYNILIHNLFNACFDIKKKYDEFKDDIHDDIYEKINQSRREAVEAMTRLKQRSGASSGEEESQRGLMQAQRIRDIQHENHGLGAMLMKMKALRCWRQNHDNNLHVTRSMRLKLDAERSRKECLKVKMLREKERLLLEQQLIALRSALKLSEKECEQVKKDLDKELKAKKEKAHANQQRAQSQKQVEEARRANIDKLLEEMEDKDLKLNVLSSEREKNKRMQQLMTEKAKKDVTHIKRQLLHERNLKLDAFQRVDELQTQVYDHDAGLYGTRPSTAYGYPKATVRFSVSPKANQLHVSSDSQSQSRAASAGAVRNRAATSASSHSLTPWPAPNNRSLTPGPELDAGRSGVIREKKMARPKTTVGRLRSRLSEQLLNDLDPPDHHETLVKLQALQSVQQMRENKVF